MTEEKEKLTSGSEVNVDLLVMPKKWQLVSEGLPPEKTRCIVYGRWQDRVKTGKKAGELKGDYTILSLATLHKGEWYRKDFLREWHCYDSDKITHYMVIPSLPLFSA